MRTLNRLLLAGFQFLLRSGFDTKARRLREKATAVMPKAALENSDPLL